MQTQKYATIAIVAALTLALITASISMPSAEAVKKTDSKKKPTTCKNVKILITVNNVVNGTVLDVDASLNGKNVSKTVTVELNETEDESSTVVPIQFKKIECKVGDAFNGDVNGVTFEGTLKSTKKPNKISVDLPEQ